MSLRVNPILPVNYQISNNYNNNYGLSAAKPATQGLNFLSLTNPDYNVARTTRGMNFKAARAIQEDSNKQAENFAGVTDNNSPRYVNNGGGKTGIAGARLNLIC